MCGRVRERKQKERAALAAHLDANASPRNDIAQLVLRALFRCI